MTPARLRLALWALLLNACAYAELTPGRCEFGAVPTRCRAGYLCTPEGLCTPPCTRGEPRACVAADGGAGEYSCLGDAWSACEPSARCVPSTTAPCAIMRAGRAFYGEQTCQADGGAGACVEVAASRCTSRPHGACADAGRLFEDVEGCSNLSYALIPDFADVESCPGDGVDNDCDGYIDELFATESSNACGPGAICSTRGDGLLKAYRTCDDPTCLDSGVLIDRLTDAGYLPLDRCDDGVDRDCSGVAGEGAPVFLRRAEEAAPLGDALVGDTVAYRVVMVDGLSDGGRGLSFTTWTSTLGIAATPDDLGPAIRDTKPLDVRHQSGGLANSVIAWRSGPAEFTLAKSLGNVAPLRRSFTTLYPLVDTPEIAQIGREVLVAAPFAGTLLDGGVGTNYVFTAIGDAQPGGQLDSGTLLQTAPLLLSGDGSPTAGAFTRIVGSGSIELGLDAGLLDAGFLPYGPALYFAVRRGNTLEPRAVAMTSLGGRRVALVVDRFRLVELSSFVTGDAYAGAQIIGLQLDSDVSELTLAARSLADGGLAFLAGASLPNGHAALFDRALRVRDLGPAAGRVALAVSPEMPDYALLTIPRPEDAGTAIYGQVICLPRD